MPIKPLQKGLTPQEESEIVAKGEALQHLRTSPGWAVLVDLIDDAVSGQMNITSLDLRLPDSKLGHEIRVRRETEKRVRHLFQNVVSLVTRADYIVNLRRIKSSSGIIFEPGKVQRKKSGRSHGS